MADIKWTFFADTNAAERAIQALEQKYNNLENSLKRTSKTSKSASESMVEGLTRTVAAYAGMGAIIGTIISGNQQLIAQAEEAGAKFDNLFRKFRVQGNLSELQGNTAKANIVKAAQAVAFSPEQAATAATQLVSSGFSAEQAQGPALVPFLKTLAGSNQVGANVDSAPLARAMTAYLNSQGMDLNAANMEKTGVGIQRLFKSQDIQLADMENIAKVGSVFRGKLSTEEQFSSIAALKNSGLAGPEAAVGLRNAVQAMTTQGLNKQKVQALKGLGLTPDQIDMQGESFTDALGTMNTAFSKVDPTKLDPLMKEFFEKEGVAAVKTLLNNSGKIGEMNTMQGDVAGFNTDVDIATSGRNAAGRRLKASNELKASEADQQSDNYRAALEKYDRDKGTNQFVMAGDLAVYDLQRKLGISPESALFTAAGENNWQAVVAVMEEANKGVSEQTKLLEDINATLKENKPPQKMNRNANVDNARGD